MIRGLSGRTILLLLAVLFAGGLLWKGSEKPQAENPLAEAQTTLRDGFGFTVEQMPSSGGGLKVLEVRPNSPAQEWGLKVGDVVEAVNESSVWHAQNLVDTMGAAYQQGNVRLMLRNKDVYRTVTIRSSNASAPATPKRGR
jgi:S1-C subfamily serine protease